MLNTADISTKELKPAMVSEALKTWNKQFTDRQKALAFDITYLDSLTSDLKEIDIYCDAEKVELSQNELDLLYSNLENIKNASKQLYMDSQFLESLVQIRPNVR